MTLRQLRCFHEVIRAQFNLSVAASALHISQPGVSRYIQLLEDELDVRLFVRRKNRLVSLTPAGQAVAEVVRRTLFDVQSIHAVANDHRDDTVGRLVIATNPGHARYSLPPVMEQFIKRHPRVRVRIRQGTSAQVAQWVLNGEAEVFLSTGPTEPNRQLLLVPCHPIHPVVLAPSRHPLATKRRIRLEDLCQWPLITYDAEFAFHANIMRTFEGQGLTPDILLSATDADIMKIYVRAGLGIALVAHSAHDPRADRGLKAIDVRHLFTSTVLHIGLRRNGYITRHLSAFLQLFAPQLDAAALRQSAAQ